MSRLIKPGNIKKEFQEESIQFNGTFHGLKITKGCNDFIKFLINEYHKVPVFPGSREGGWLKNIFLIALLKTP